MFETSLPSKPAKKERIRKSLKAMVANFNRIDCTLTPRQKKGLGTRTSLGGRDYVVYFPIKGHEEMVGLFHEPNGNTYRITVAKNPVDYRK